MDQQVFRLFNSLTKETGPFVAGDPSLVTMYTCGPTVYDYAHIGNFRSFLFADVLRRWLESPLCAVEDEKGKVHAGPRRVVQVMNLTDVGHMTDDEAADGAGEDKMEAAARRLLEAKKSGKLPSDAPKDFDPTNPYHIARFYEGAFLEDAELLGVKVAGEREDDARVMPRATEHVREMLAMIARLLKNDHAYVSPKGDAAYFDTQKFGDYGELSGNTLDKLRAGAGGRVSGANQSEKKHPADFLLWKKDASHVMKWDPAAPEMLGNNAGPLAGMVGYPGWHIECSAMAESSVRALAGEGFRHTLDLHTGGEDNIFPHHECEIAQSRCAWDTERFARQWAHVRHLMVEGEKMSKSKGNFYTIRDLIAKGFDPAAIRLELIKTHYRSNANFTSQGLQDSERREGRWRKCARWLTAKARKFEHHSTHRTLSDGEIWERIKHSDASVRLVRSASHDLNLSVVLAALDLMSSDIEAIDEHPKGITSLSPTNAPGVSIPHAPLRSFQTIPFNNTMTDADFADLIKLAAFHLIDGVLGVIFCPPQEKPTLYDAHTNELRLARDAARKAKDWAASDRLRDELVALGYEVKDTAQGTVVTRKASL